MRAPCAERGEAEDGHRHPAGDHDAGQGGDAARHATFKDGFPDDATVQKVYDNLDFQRGVQAFLTAMPAASLSAMREGLKGIGASNSSVMLFESLMDSKTLFLTPNTESIYFAGWLDLKDGPLVVETPPNILGFVNDFWFRYVTDMGNAGPDKGKGGKFLFLPPGYKGAVPAGYFVSRPNTFGNWLVGRGFMVNGSPTPAVESIKKHLRIYPLSQAAKPPETTFINGSGKAFNTIHAMDFSFFDEVNKVVQEEPASAMDPETLGLLASIGIEKGKPFQPDERMRKILAEAAAVGAATARTITYKSRIKESQIFPNGSWGTAFVGGSYEFLHNGARLLDPYASFFFVATGITPAMSMARVGVGSQYAGTYIDSIGPPARRRPDLQADAAGRHSGEGFLVAGALRHADALGAADRPAVPEPRQPEGRRRGERRQIGGRLLRPQAACRQGEQLGADDARQGLVRDPAVIRSAAAVVRQDLAARRDRRDEVSRDRTV